MRAKKPCRPKAVNPARRKREWDRAYGSKERVQWVRTLPCVACGRVGFSENAHVTNTDKSGGGSRRAGYQCIAPLCGYLWSILNNCHGALHRLGPASFQLRYHIDLASCAAATEKAWLARCAARREA